MHTDCMQSAGTIPAPTLVPQSGTTTALPATARVMTLENRGHSTTLREQRQHRVFIPFPSHEPRFDKDRPDAAINLFPSIGLPLS
ncbi:hypothetical protein CCHR01_17665 [Colletotrichum chrysophilum]|uniref:Uncharacterized protein n=1 Tax=Colletotrichum chrysophilum TaxID=1836956 RepID=A0AAD9E8W3_9PEZI|nr:hypothetical protein CCHR01_17665 [Colletotrichum chrysophilum]